MDNAKSLLIAIYLIMVAFGTISSCSRYNSVVDAGPDNSGAQLERIPSDTIIDTTRTTILAGYSVDDNCDRLLLEVVDERFGMASPQGKILNIRILKDGELEYDRIDGANDVTRSRSKLSAGQLKDVVKRIESVRLPIPESKFRSHDDACVDALFEKTVTMCALGARHRQSAKVQECQPFNSAPGGDIPSALAELISYVSSISIEN